MTARLDYVPRFEVMVEGTTFDEGGVISNLVVKTSVEGADTCSFTLGYEYDHEHRRFTGLDWSLFTVGTAVTASIGYGNEPLTKLFAGRISSVNPEFPASGSPTVSVDCYGLTQSMMRGTNSTSWNYHPIGAIVGEVAAKYFEPAEISIEGGLTVLPKSIQNDQSDYQFLSDIAEKYGFELFGSRGTFHFRPLSAREASPSVTLSYGVDLRSFSPQVDVSRRVDVAVVLSWDPDMEEDRVGIAVSADAGADASRITSVANLRGLSENAESAVRVFRTPVSSTVEAQRVARAKLTALRGGYLTGSGETTGNPAVYAGIVIHLDGITDEFSGDYYVTEATHRVGQSGYQTSFQVADPATVL